MKIDLNAPKGKLKAQAKTVLKKGNSMQPVRPTEPVPFPPPPPRPHEPKEMDKQAKITPYYLKEVPEPPPPPKPRFGEPPAPHIAPPPPPQAAEPPCVNPLSGPMMKPPGYPPPPPPSDKPVKTQKMIPMPFLPYATKDRLGAVKVGDGIEVDDKGKIYLTHDSVLDVVGTGDEENKGLVKLSDAIDDLESDVNSGTAATPKAVATVKAALDEFIETAKKAFEELSAEDLNYWLNNSDTDDILNFLKALIKENGGLAVDDDGKMYVDWDALLAKLSGDNIDNLREQMKVVWYRDDITTLYGHDRTFYFDSYTSDALTAEIRSEISDLANADFFGMQLSMWNGQEKWQFVYNTPTMYIRYLTNDSAVTAGGGNDEWSDWKSFNLKTDLMTKSEIESLIKETAPAGILPVVDITFGSSSGETYYLTGTVVNNVPFQLVKGAAFLINSIPFIYEFPWSGSLYLNIAGTGDLVLTKYDFANRGRPFYNISSVGNYAYLSWDMPVWYNGSSWENIAWFEYQDTSN